MEPTSREVLDELREVLYGEPCPEGWARLMAVFVELTPGEVLETALDYTCPHLARRAEGWRAACRVLPGPWLPDAGQDPRRRLVEAMGVPPELDAIWMPPGRFTMGSPPDEPGRFIDEELHPVALTRPFILWRTPVTQDLWRATLDATAPPGPLSAPSRFEGAQRPVESITWFEAVAFCNARSALDGLAPCYLTRQDEVYGWEHAAAALPARWPGAQGEGWRLPTEAEWEYACRAGTTGPLYRGALEIRGLHDAPALDPIAWYGGNSGVDDLEAVDSSDWAQMQYPANFSATHPVGLKAPNPWGLRDMLGNVHEWCWDLYGDYVTTLVIDPTGAGNHTSNTGRIARGGAWYSYARYARAAMRHETRAGYRMRGLGMRLARTA